VLSLLSPFRIDFTVGGTNLSDDVCCVGFLKQDVDQDSLHHKKKIMEQTKKKEIEKKKTKEEHNHKQHR